MSLIAFCCRRLAVSNAPKHTMQKNSRELVEILRNEGHDAFQEAWKHLFFDVDEVRAITEVIEESHKAEVL